MRATRLDHLDWILANDTEAMRTYVPTRGPAATACGRCSRRLSSPRDVVEIHDTSGSYPKHWRTLVVGLYHEKCARGRGYLIRMADLARDGWQGPRSWGDQLQQKTWWAPTYEYDLASACQIALAIDRRAREAASAEHPRAAGSTRPARSISPRTRAYVLERDGFRCRRCGASPDDGVRLVVDHIVPVAAGGTADVDNLQTLCEPDNQGKRDRAPHPHDLRPFGGEAR